MPKVTNIAEKKNKLYNDFLFSQKGKTRKQISNHWKKYRNKKYTITELPKYRKKYARAKDEIQQNILREKYFEKKEKYVQQFEYDFLKIQKKVKQKFSEQDFYIIKKGKHLDTAIKKIFADSKKKVRYILVTLKIRLSETDQIIFVSDTLTPASFENMQNLGVTAMEKIMEKLSFVSKYDGYEIISKHLRLIYALPEKSKE